MEASGKSLPEAKEIVLDLLGVAEDDAEFVVLSEPKPGLFGRLRGEARVQARVRPVAPPPKRGRRPKSDKRREGGDRSRGGGGDAEERIDRLGAGRPDQAEKRGRRQIRSEWRRHRRRAIRANPRRGRRFDVSLQWAEAHGLEPFESKAPRRAGWRWRESQWRPAKFAGEASNRS